MITATAQAAANIAFIQYRLAKLGRTDGKACFGGNLFAERAILLTPPIQTAFSIGKTGKNLIKLSQFRN